MKLQLNILKKVIWDNKKTIMLYFVLLLLYFFVQVIANGGGLESFFYIFGTLDINNNISIILFLFNFILVFDLSYKYITFEILDFNENIILREDSKKFVLKKIIVLILFIIMFKIVQILFFNILLKAFSDILLVDIKFYLSNIVAFLFIGLCSLILAFNSRKNIILICSVLTFEIIMKQKLLVYITEILLIAYIIYNFNFKRLLEHNNMK